MLYVKYYYFLCSLIVFSLIIVCFKISSSDEDFNLLYLEQYKKEVYSLADKYEIPPESIAGVILAENYLNINYLDNLQVIQISRNLAKSEDWWDKWFIENEREALKSYKVHLISNKWPLKLVLSGYVNSIGPAQITPRTAIRACAIVGLELEVCNKGIKVIVENLLTERGSVVFAALVINFEAEEFKKLSGYNSKSDIGLLATLYNTGSGFYFEEIYESKQIKYNKFGRWVDEKSSIIKYMLNE